MIVFLTGLGVMLLLSILVLLSYFIMRRNKMRKQRLDRLSEEQAQLGVPHSRIQVELVFILQAGTC